MLVLGLTHIAHHPLIYVESRPMKVQEGFCEVMLRAEDVQGQVLDHLGIVASAKLSVGQS
jgi:hypothetical protein